METTVLLVDDHPLFRKGIRFLLEGEEDMRIAGEAGDGQAAIDLVRELNAGRGDHGHHHAQAQRRRGHPADPGRISRCENHCAVHTWREAVHRGYVSGRGRRLPPEGQHPRGTGERHSGRDARRGGSERRGGRRCGLGVSESPVGRAGPGGQGGQTSGQPDHPHQATPAPATPGPCTPAAPVGPPGAGPATPPDPGLRCGRVWQDHPAGRLAG